MSHTMAHAETSVHGMNVGTAERLASIAAGGILVTRFFQKRTAGKILAAVVGQTCFTEASVVIRRCIRPWASIPL